MKRDEKFPNALATVRSVFEGELTQAEVCRLQDHMQRLAVAHAVMHALSQTFFHPGTTRLRGHYNDALALLVSEVHWSQDLVQASCRLHWHQPVEGMHGRSEGSVRLATPTEVLALVNNHAKYAADKFYSQAVERHRCESRNLWQ